MAAPAELVGQTVSHYRIMEKVGTRICTIHEIGTAEGRLFIVMGYLEGITLKHRIGGKPLDTEQCCCLASRLPTRL